MIRAFHGLVVELGELTDPGLDPGKQVNEDAMAAAETPVGQLFVVCDGMGGHVGGREASHAAIRTIVESVVHCPAGTPPVSALHAAVAAAGRAVYAVGGTAQVHGRPGSTCVAALLHEGGVAVSHVGDSRVYMVRAGGIHRLTRDHSMVQQMIDAGQIGPDEAYMHPESNIITRALGMGPEVEVESRPDSVVLYPGDLLVLCTDGLTDLARDEEILQVMSAALPGGLDAAAQALIKLANDRGGHDNITVQLVSVRATAHHAPPPVAVTERAPAMAAWAPAPAPSGGGTIPMQAAPSPIHATPPPVATFHGGGSSGGGGGSGALRWALIAGAVLLLLLLFLVGVWGVLALVLG